MTDSQTQTTESTPFALVVGATAFLEHGKPVASIELVTPKGRMPMRLRGRSLEGAIAPHSPLAVSAEVLDRVVAAVAAYMPIGQGRAVWPTEILGVPAAAIAMCDRYRFDDEAAWKAEDADAWRMIRAHGQAILDARGVAESAAGYGVRTEIRFGKADLA